jgi:hypothetical protein
MVRWSLVALGIATLGIGVVGYASARPSRGESAGDAELLLGDYRCGSDFQTAFQWLTFQATNGILDDYQFVSGNLPLVSTPAEVCDPAIAAMAEVLSGRACSVSGVEFQRDDSGEAQSFRFVCDGPRDHVVRTMAAAARVIVTPGAP